MDWTEVQGGRRTSFFYLNDTEKTTKYQMNVTLHVVQKATTHKQDPTTKGGKKAA
jgi:hypothetical protein